MSYVRWSTKVRDGCGRCDVWRVTPKGRRAFDAKIVFYRERALGLLG